MKITVKEDFITYRGEKVEQYNKRRRSMKQFLRDIDCELYEWTMIDMGEWKEHESWMVDAITPDMGNVDVKFISKGSQYWDVWDHKVLNVLKQSAVLDGYYFMEWVSRPAKRELEAGDEVEVRPLGLLPYRLVADNVYRSSYTDFFVPARSLLTGVNKC